MTPVATAALELLRANNPPMTRKAGSFLGQLVVDATPMTEKQADWLATLLDRAGLPPLSEEDTGR
ncbi:MULTISPECIES: hypothetical protein [unclassified Sphingomonas]|uniref:hypothetical protein n=1 Tax=unclassified Sphingomonas TaxID=196159 RepID=UPI0006FF97A3|nr:MULTISPECIES: hypothetical protein [unclassified Sphingomonas]KQM24830.1 hypothetical protein ASE58_15680 [Sphingomonas sp. Leaf9]KQM42488.1 hypothetical protein ASE57_15680 [Sphingomonas sp. Leaf11]